MGWLIPGVGWAEEAGNGQVLVPGLGWVDDPASGGSPDATASGATLTGTSALSPGSASGNSSVNASATGATLTGTASLTAGATSGTSSGAFVSEIMVNNAGSVLSNTAVVWTWWQGSIGSAPTSTTHGSGTTSGTGMLTASGLPTGAGFLLVRTVDSTGVYYQPGTVV